MKTTAKVSCALLMVAALMAADAQYQRKTTTVLERQDFYRSPERENIQNDRFIRLDRVDQLPTAVRNHVGNLASPEEPSYNECSGPWDEPVQRLIFAAQSDDHLIVYYQLGCSSTRIFQIYSFPERKPMQLITNKKEEMIIHRGGGSTTVKAQNTEELKAAILEAGSRKSASNN